MFIVNLYSTHWFWKLNIFCTLEITWLVCEMLVINLTLQNIIEASLIFDPLLTMTLTLSWEEIFNNSKRWSKLQHDTLSDRPKHLLTWLISVTKHLYKIDSFSLTESRNIYNILSVSLEMIANHHKQHYKWCSYY